MVVLLLFEVDVAHVYSKTTSLWVLLVLENDGVTVQGLLVTSVCVVHVGQVVEHVEGEIDVDLIERLCIFSKLSDFLLLGSSFFGLCQCFGELFLNLKSCTVFKESVDLFFEFFKVILFTLFFFGLNRFIGSLNSLIWFWLALETSGSIRFHSSTQSLLSSGPSHSCTQSSSSAGGTSILIGRWRRLLLNILKVIRIANISCSFRAVYTER